MTGIFRTIEDDADFESGISALRKRLTYLKLNIAIESVSTVVAGLCIMALALGALRILEMNDRTIDLLLFGSAMAPFVLLVTLWIHDWYYREQTESVLRGLTDYVIAKRKARLGDGSANLGSASRLVRDLSSLQRSSIRRSTPLLLPFPKALGVMSVLSILVILGSILTMAVRFDVFG